MAIVVNCPPSQFRHISHKVDYRERDSSSFFANIQSVCNEKVILAQYSLHGSLSNYGTFHATFGPKVNYVCQILISILKNTFCSLED